jgi:hypothetical protein
MRLNRKAFLEAMPFITALLLTSEPTKPTKLDELVVDLNRTMSAGRFVGNTVIYERDEWDRIQDDISKIVAIAAHPCQRT